MREKIIEIEKVMERNRNLIDSIRFPKEGKTVTETGIEVLVETLDISNLEAENILQELEEGLTEFSNVYRIISEEDKSISELMDMVTEGMNSQQKRNVYANILTAIHIVNNKNMGEMDIRELQSRYIHLSPEELISVLEMVLEKDIAWSDLRDVILTEADDENKTDGGQINQVAVLLDKDNDNYRLSAAIVLYILQRKGLISLSKEGEILPSHMIGLMTASGVQLAIEQAKQNKDGTPRPTLLDKILKALNISILKLMAIALCSVVAIVIAIQLAKLVGVALMSLAVGFAVAIYVVRRDEDYRQTFNDFLERMQDNTVMRKILSIIEYLKKTAEKIKGLNMISDPGNVNGEGRRTEDRSGIFNETPPIKS